jgi:hypothetical protein
MALAAALKCRAKVGIAPWQPICPIELALGEGLDVRFVDIPSLEGMYWKRSDPIILLGAERPRGRQLFTCAHELGHHYFGHGTRIHEVLDDRALDQYEDENEYMANVFGAFLLMPKSAVERAFAVREEAPNRASAARMFAIACSLGVGYRTLVTHLKLSLNMISSARAKELLRQTPKTIRTSILKDSAESDLVVVDACWDSVRAVDLQVGDFAVLPRGTRLEGSIGNVVSAHNEVALRTVQPGIGRLVRDGWTTYLRVSRRSYVGRALFRHLEEPDD